ncbi:MAG: hypothetical protein IT282_11095 [Bacteroidetes bacterium]|nr:hypothetical protein [Bacteroidota bacterium]
MGSILLSINLIFVLVISFRVARLLMRGTEPWRAILGTTALIPLVIWLSILLLGTAGLLSPVNITLMLGFLALGSFVVRPSLAKGADPPAETTLPVRDADWKSHLAVAALAGALLPLVGKLLVRGNGMSPEDLDYHGPFAANAILTGGFDGSNLYWMNYFPFNADVVSLWPFLLSGTDGSGALAGVFWLALLAVSGISLVRASGGSWAQGFLTSALMTSSLVVAGEAQRLVSPELAGTAMTVAAIALLIPRQINSHRVFHTPSLVLAGLLVGWAAGAKVLFLHVSVLITLWILLADHRGTPGKERWRAVVWFVLAATCTGSYWYIRTFLLSGNPFFPSEFGPFDGPFKSALVWKTTFLAKIFAEDLGADRPLSVLAGYLRWPVALFVLCAIGYGWTLLRGILARGEIGVPGRGVLVLILLTGTISTVAFPLLPFSGSVDAPDALFVAIPRYLVLPFTMGVLAFALTLGRTNAGFLLGLGAVVVSFVEMRAAYSFGIACATFVALRWTPILKMRAPGRRLRVAAFVAMVAGVALWVPYITRVADARTFNQMYYDEFWGDCWKSLETLPPGSRMAWFGPSNEYYPLYGRRLHLVPVAVEEDGTLHRPLHEQWRTHRAEVRWWEHAAIPDAATLLENLQESEVQYVLLQKRPEGWPKQDRLLASTGKTVVVYEDQANKIRLIRNNALPDSQSVVSSGR